MLTPEQSAAIQTRDAAVALSAGAGCGKTFVLTARFLSHLEPKQPDAATLSELVAITFTDRAAREMRDRVRRRLNDCVLEAPDAETAGHWLAILRELETARISTIHSYCGSLLRAHAVEAGLDPQFGVLDESESQALISEAIDDELRRLLAARHDATMELTLLYGLDQLRQIVSAAVAARGEIDFDQWRQQAPEALAERWEAYHRERVVPLLAASVTECDAAIELKELLTEHEPGNGTMQERRAVILETLSRLGQSSSPLDDLESLNGAARVQGGGGKKVWQDEDVYERVQSGCTALRNAIKSVQKSMAFNADAALDAARTGLQVLEIARPIVEAYEQRKRALSRLDFQDLMIRAAKLLLDPRHKELRQRLGAGLRLLLVDEFQDTDPLQVNLVKAVCGDDWKRGRLFFVGDFKQSIYRFRGAQPGVFRQLQDETPEAGRLPLTLNFRSQPAILDFVNALFSDAFANYQPLRAFRGQVSEPPCVELLWAPAEQPHEKADALRQREADWIARRLRQLFDSQASIVWDDESPDDEPRTRPVRPGDCALLFSALSDVALYEKALQQHGIDYYLVGSRAFYAQQEVFDLLNLLRSLASSNDVVSLAGVLRSPFFSLADETLYWLAQHRDGLSGGLFAKQLAANLDEEQTARVRFAAETLRTLRANKDRLPIAQLILQALQLTGYDALLVAEFMGERKLANLHKLIDQARTFDRSGAFTLADFIGQLAGFVVDQPNEAVAATQPESHDVVRLMTIHQSKGLEFPVVVVPDLDRAAQGSSKPFVFDPELGPLTRRSDIDDFGAGIKLHAAVEKMEEAEERKRLFYVAATRAADYLILSSGVKSIGAAKGPFTRLLASRFDLSNGELTEAARAQLAPDAQPPEVRVTATAPAVGEKAKSPRRPNLHKLVERARGLAKRGEGAAPASLSRVPHAAAARREFSFSRLSGAIHLDAPAPEIEDDPLAGNPAAARFVDPLGLGTLVHDVLEQIPFGQPVDLARLVAHFAEIHLPGDEEGAAQALELVSRFLASPRAADMAAARQMHKEREFMLAWPPGDRQPGGRFLRGYIDCLYEDSQGAWRLIDYKTNHTTAATLAATAAGYEMQMLVYALAVERVLGSPPKSMTLCFLRPGLEYQFQLDDSARDRAVEMVNQAMASFVEQDGEE